MIRKGDTLWFGRDSDCQKLYLVSEILFHSARLCVGAYSPVTSYLTFLSVRPSGAMGVRKTGSRVSYILELDTIPSTPMTPFCLFSLSNEDSMRWLGDVCKSSMV